MFCVLFHAYFYFSLWHFPCNSFVSFILCVLQIDKYFQHVSRKSSLTFKFHALNRLFSFFLFFIIPMPIVASFAIKGRVKIHFRRDFSFILYGDYYTFIR